MNNGLKPGFTLGLPSAVTAAALYLTGSATLTAAQVGNGVSVPWTTTAPGQILTLPPANKMSPSAAMVNVKNAGLYYGVVKNAAGTDIGFLRPGDTCILGLVDPGSVAGVWNATTLSKEANTASASLSIAANFESNPASFNNQTAIRLDANRTLILGSGYASSGANIYGIVWDASLQQFGALTTIYSGSCLAFSSILSGTNQVLIVGFTSSSMLGIVLTISGTTISVPTSTSQGLGSATPFSQYCSRLVKVGNTFCIAWWGGSSPYYYGVVPITLSGNSITWSGMWTSGSTTSTTSVAPPLLFVSGNILRMFFQLGSVGTAQPFTVSGNTLTPGTSATFIFAANNGLMGYQLGTGNILIFPENSNTIYLFSLSGTTETRTSVSGGNAGAWTNTTTQCMFNALSSNSALFGFMTGSTFYTNILTDTAGTLSIGTEIDAITGGGALIGQYFMGNSAGTVTLKSYSTTNEFTSVLNCTGASPTLTSLTTTPTTLMANAYSGYDFYMNPQPNSVSVGGYTYVVGSAGQYNSQQGAFCNSGTTFASGVTAIRIGSQPGDIKTISETAIPIVTTTTGTGALRFGTSGNDLWSTVTAASKVSITRVEFAA